YRENSAENGAATPDSEPHIDLTADASGTTSPPTDSSPEPAASVSAGPPDTSPSLESARSAETFLSGENSQAIVVVSDSEEATPSASSAGVAPAPTEEEPEPAKKPRGRVRSWFAGIKDVGLRVKGRVKEHNLAVVAAGIAFWGLLAIPAVLTATLSIYGLVADEEDVAQQIEDNLGALPEEARSIITDQLESIAGASSGGLAVGAIVGILLALWTSSGAVAKLITTFNTIWDVEEERKFFKLRGISLLITLGAIGAIVVAAFLLAILPAVLAEAGLANEGRYAINSGRFPALLVVMVLGLSFLYWVGPDRRARYRVVTWGAVLATLLWLLVSGLFSIYTARFGSYNETYGSLGAIVIMLMWLFLTSFMVLLGAEIDAARDARRSESSPITAAGTKE
ncbi:MAG: YhjD/YihY/BrkB family envelope integrity protein, partial [Acidimicrobiales bacterium]